MQALRTRPGRTRALAAAGAAAVALTACGGGGAGGGSPAEVVAAGLDARLTNGAAFELSVEGDLAALETAAGEPAPPEIATLLEEGLISGAFSPDGAFALAVGPDDGFVALRFVDEALYLRVDLDAIREFASGSGQAIPPADVLQSQVAALGLPGELQSLVQAALAGEWIGITGLSREAIESFAESFGAMPSGQDTAAQQEAIRAALEDAGLLDGATFTERYLEVSGEGPTYSVTVMARALVETLNELAAELPNALGPMAGAPTDLPAPEDVPEEVSGFAVTVEDGKATAIAADVSAIAESVGAAAEDLGSGDLVVTLELSDLGDQLSVPADATTVDFQTLVQAVMGAFMGGLGSTS